ncbi:MAG: hypothetical protein ABR608_15965 [Pseudonocardiaceae bacterium]
MRDAIVLAFTLLFPALGLLQVSRAPGAGAGRASMAVRDRGEVLTVIATSVVILMFSRAVADWDRIPPAVWLVGLLLTALTVAVGGRVWTRLEWLTSPRPRLRAATVVSQLVLAGVLLVILG